MKLIGLTVALFMLFFCMFGIQVAIDAGMIRRFRRREHFTATQNHLTAKQTHSPSKMVSSTVVSIVKVAKKLANQSGIFNFFAHVPLAERPLAFSKRTPRFFSALLAPPLVPPPKA